MTSKRYRAFLLPCLLAGVLCITTIVTKAQEEDSRIFSNYVFAGVTSSQISGDRLNGFDQLGYNAGVGTEIRTSETWRPRLEILFNQLGSRKNARPDEGDFESYLLRLNYIQVPLTMGYMNGTTGFELGLAPSYLLSFREEDQNGTVIGLGRDFKEFDLGALAGIRYRFALQWELGTRFYQSIVPVREHTGGSTFRLNRGQYNTAIQFSLRFIVK
jgi:hypothetical protein